MERTALKISVIVPVYKVEPYLRRCVDSILAQTHKNLEVILVDDGSPDGCPAICDEYAAKDSRVKVIHKENGGVSSARNAGLDTATGDYIGFVDSDDWIEPDMYEDLLGALKETEADFSMCGFALLNGPEAGRETMPPEVMGDRCAAGSVTRTMLYSITQENYPNPIFDYCWGKLFDARLWDKIRFDTMVSVGEDAFAVFQVLQHCFVVGFCRKALYHYDIRPDSAAHSDGLTKSRNIYNMTKRMVELDSLTPDVRVLCVENAVAYTFCYINWLARDNDKKEYKRVCQIFEKQHMPEIQSKWRQCRPKYKWGIFLLHYTPGLFWIITKWRFRE